MTPEMQARVLTVTEQRLASMSQACPTLDEPGQPSAASGKEYLESVYAAEVATAYADALRQAKADGATHVILHPLLQVASKRAPDLTVGRS